MRQESNDRIIDLEFTSSNLGISRTSRCKRVCEKSHRIGEYYGS